MLCLEEDGAPVEMSTYIYITVITVSLQKVSNGLAISITTQKEAVFITRLYITRCFADEVLHVQCLTITSLTSLTIVYGGYFVCCFSLYIRIMYLF